MFGLGGTLAAMGLRSSHSAEAAGWASASHSFGFSPKSLLREPSPGGGGSSTPAAIASSMRRLNRLLRKNDLSTIAHETNSNTNNVAKNVNRYSGVD